MGPNNFKVFGLQGHYFFNDKGSLRVKIIYICWVKNKKFSRYVNHLFSLAESAGVKFGVLNLYLIAAIIEAVETIILKLQKIILSLFIHQCPFVLNCNPDHTDVTKCMRSKFF